jgi:glyoxylase-like metal-dependent hydrolase (beta-lactamase superfamily II)
MPDSLTIHTIVSQPFQENTYIVWRGGRGDCLVIDPGLEPELILAFLRDQRLVPASILLTHGHADHIGGNAALKEAFPNAPILVGAKDAVMLEDANVNLSACFGMAVTSPKADRLLHEGDCLDLAGITLEVLDIPGHSPGHVVFLYRDHPCRVFGGDVLFQGSVGRTDFPGSDGRALFTGIRTKLFTLPGDTVVFPGHGPTTTIGRERRTNPFVGDETLE